MNICILTRTPSPDEIRLLPDDKESVCLLAGQALLSPAASFGERQVWVMDEEIRELGMDCKLPPTFTAKTASEIVEALANAKVLNF